MRKTGRNFCEIGIGPCFAAIPASLDRRNITSLPAEVIEKGEQVRSGHCFVPVHTPNSLRLMLVAERKHRLARSVPLRNIAFIPPKKSWQRFARLSFTIRGATQ